MKQIMKKNQIIITTLAILIAAAGYLNYSGKLFKESNGGSKPTGEKLADQELLDLPGEEIQTESKELEEGDSETDKTPGEAMLTNNDVQTGIAEAKISREQVRAQNKETLQSIIDNTAVSEQEKENAAAQMIQMTELSEQEAAIETLLASKGFSEVVVSLTADSADIVVDSAELSDGNRAQIEDIVLRKTHVPPENVVIMPIYK